MTRHFNRKLYKDAYDIFVLLYGYKDSIDRANESKYHYALQLLNGKHFEDAIKAFQQISWYQDAGERLQEAKYNYALYLSTIRPSSNDPDWKKASDIFKELGDYEDSKTKYKETYYEYGLDLLSSLSFKEAIAVFESLGNYEDSKTQVKEAKYRYVFWHKNNTDLTTYEYLKDLKKSGYKDSKDIYKSLYAWKVINIYFNSSENATDKKYNISKYDPVYCHFELSGGPPEESIFLYHKVIYPAGDNTGKVKPDYKQSRGSTSWWGWADGIYQTPYYGATGTLTFKFYDEEGNLIGEGSVAITD